MVNAHHRRALLLDSNQSSQLLLEFTMAMGYIDFETFDNVSEALAHWRPGQYDLLFIDTDSIDHQGPELIGHVRRQDGAVAIIVYGTTADDPAIAAVIEAGADLYLVKPFDLDLLMTLMKIVNAENLRETASVLVIDEKLRPRWESRGAAPQREAE